MMTFDEWWKKKALPDASEVVRELCREAWEAASSEDEVNRLEMELEEVNDLLAGVLAKPFGAKGQKS